MVYDTCRTCKGDTKKHMGTFDYVDIGTSSFDTALDIRKRGETVLLVEPLWSYLDRLPDEEGVEKFCAAISDTVATRTKIFYIKPEVIEKYGFPEFIKGCNSINKPHPTVLSMLKACKLDPKDFITEEFVLTITFDQLLDMYDIKKIGFLKIDTEGHDHIILKDVINAIKNKRVQITKIKFEYNPFFGNIKELDELIKDQESGFTQAQLIDDNVTLT